VPGIKFDASNNNITVDGGVVTSAIFVKISQPSHGFIDGQPVFYNGSEWALAKADAAETLGTHIVKAVDVDNFKAVQSGVLIGMSGLTPGGYYFVSESTLGLLTSTEPSTGFSNPVGQALSANSLMVMPWRATEVS